MTPRRHAALEVADGISTPDDLATGGIETGEMAHRAKGVDAARVDAGCGARPIAVLHFVVVHGVFVNPPFLASGGIKADDAFDLALHRSPVHNNHTTARHGDAAIAAADSLLPARLEIIQVKLFGETGLVPDAIALGAA